jgi:plastocyanin
MPDLPLRPAAWAILLVLFTTGCAGTIPTDGTFTAAMTKHSEEPVMLTYTVASAAGLGADGGPAWVGASAPIDGVVNPVLYVPSGSVLRLVMRNDDGEPHNIGILNASGGVVASFTTNVTGVGNETSVEWRASPVGAYSYRCEGHSHEMEGRVVVAGADAQMDMVPSSEHGALTKDATLPIPTPEVTERTGPDPSAAAAAPAPTATSEAPAAPAATPTPAPPAPVRVPTSAQGRGAFSVSQAFRVASTDLTVAPWSLPALGRESEPAVLSDPAGDARTALKEDSWVFSALVQETENNAAPVGIYRASLSWNGYPAGDVFFLKAYPAGTALGTTVSFDLGPALETSSAFLITLERWTGGASEPIELQDQGPAMAEEPPRLAEEASSPEGPSPPADGTAPAEDAAPPAEDTTPAPDGSPSAAGMTFILASVTQEHSVWVGRGGEIEGKTNPTLRARVGQELTFIARNEDDIVHNFGLKDAQKRLVAGWTSDIEHTGDEVTVTWTAEEAGNYVYICKYHAKTHKGILVVEA